MELSCCTMEQCCQAVEIKLLHDGTMLPGDGNKLLHDGTKLSGSEISCCTMEQCYQTMEKAAAAIHTRRCTTHTQFCTLCDIKTIPTICQVHLLKSSTSLSKLVLSVCRWPGRQTCVIPFCFPVNQYRFQYDRSTGKFVFPVAGRNYPHRFQIRAKGNFAFVMVIVPQVKNFTLCRIQWGTNPFYPRATLWQQLFGWHRMSISKQQCLYQLQHWETLQSLDSSAAFYTISARGETSKCKTCNNSRWRKGPEAVRQYNS